MVESVFQGRRVAERLVPSINAASELNMDWVLPA